MSTINASPSTKSLLQPVVFTIIFIGVILGIYSFAMTSNAVAGTNHQATDKYIYLPILFNPAAASAIGDCITAEESTLIDSLNNYRVSNGLSTVQVSKSLTQVAQHHVVDLHENNPDSGTDHGLACNTHSWSDQGHWNAVCYTGDHQFASGMWNKPREITSNVYSGNGFENSYSSSGQATAAGALAGWQSSGGHRDVILEQGIWAGSNWPAMGVAIYEHHAVMWFGDQVDPQGTVTNVCDVYANLK